MKTKWGKLVLLSFIFFTTLSSYAWDKGIYLTQYTLETPNKLDYLIRQAKATGLNTFIVDYEYPSSLRYCFSQTLELVIRGLLQRSIFNSVILSQHFFNMLFFIAAPNHP